MHKIISYPITIIFAVCFVLTLLIFHPIQWIGYNWFGYQAHKKTVDVLNWTLIRCTHILGTRYDFKGYENLPKEVPLIIVCNHQSLYDIPPVIWYMRKYHPKFISKKELGKGIPSVSYNLKYGGAALIDRKKPRQALSEIAKFGTYIETYRRAAVIFPEGTRSITGKPKKFQTKGLLTLFKKIPSAFVVPITINNSWKMQRFGKFPLGLGTSIKFTVHEPISLKKVDDKNELINHIESIIIRDIIA